MKFLIGIALIPVLGTLAPLPDAFAQAPLYASEQAARERAVFSQAGLDQMLAPIALYPDALLAQILMASTYPREVAQAARLSRAYPQLRGDDAVRAVEPYGWDPSVNALMAFPQLLAMMDERIGWTEQLGDAFLDQQPRVMESVQSLRQRAWMAGNLQSNEQVRVVRQETVLMLEQAYPQVAYAPYYDPQVIYGAWWWPALPPVHWAPWAGYRPRPGFSTGFFRGAGVSLHPGILFGRFDWPRRQINLINININNNDYNSNNAAITNRAIIDGRRGDDASAARSVAPTYWQHDPAHRRGVPYPDGATRTSGGERGAPPLVRAGAVARESSDFIGQPGAAAPGLPPARPATRFDARTDQVAPLRAFTPPAEPRRESRLAPLANSSPSPPAAPAITPTAEQARNPRRDAQHDGTLEHARRGYPENAGMPVRAAVPIGPAPPASAPRAARAAASLEPRVVTIEQSAAASAVRSMPPVYPVRPVTEVRAPQAAVGERASGLHGHDRRDSPAVAQRAPESARTPQSPSNARPPDPAARPAGQARTDGARRAL